MNLKQLETFHWVARLGSFTEAGTRLHVPQPTVSMRIRELEDELGTKLVERSGRHMRLTHQGRLLVEQVSRVVELVGLIRQQRHLPHEVTGLLRVGVAEIVATTWLPELVRVLNARFPKLNVELKLELIQTMLSDLDRGKLDLLLAPGPPRSPAEYHLRYLGSIELAFMANPEFISWNGSLKPEKLRDLPLISMGKQSILHDIEENWFRQVQGPVRRIDVANNLSMAAQLTASGLGASVLPSALYVRWIEDHKLRIIETHPPVPPLHFYMIWNRVGAHQLAELIAPLAHSVSTFERKADLSIGE